MVKEIAPGQGINLVEFLKQNIDKIEPPYFRKFNLLGVTDNDDHEVLLSSVFGFKIKVLPYPDLYLVGNSKGSEVYREKPSVGEWIKKEYDQYSNLIYYENSGYWKKWEYGKDGFCLYYETNNGIVYDYR